jgi:cullin-associated NEDD8-dissociated protein 1
MEMDEDDGWGADDGYDDQDDMNDDDTAWKVRKSSVKIIEGLVATVPGFLKAKWGNFVDLLTERFNERSNTVKIDIMSTF